MSYIPTEWKTGDIVTAEKLNKLEEGVASGGGGGGGVASPLMIQITGFIEKEEDPDYPGGVTYYYSTGVSASDLSAAYTYGSFRPVYVCIPDIGDIGASAGEPNYYRYTNDYARILTWRNKDYDVGEEGSYSIYLDASENEVVIVYYEQGGI